MRYEFTMPPVAAGDQYSDFSLISPNPDANNFPGALIFEISPSTIFEAEYNGVVGSHLQSGTVNINQVPMSTVIARPAVRDQAGRSSCCGQTFPGLNENVSLGKSFLFTERFRLDFPAEAFNLLNRIVFPAPTGNALNLNNTSFGTVTAQSSSFTPRQMQLALKLYW